MSMSFSVQGRSRCVVTRSSSLGPADHADSCLWCCPVLTQVFDELRGLLFIKVSQHAQRIISLTTFQHLHQLSLRFHLDRQTGGLSRVIERGIGAIDFALRFTLFSVLPILIEIVMVTVILFIQFDIRFAAVTFITIAGYIAFTLFITEWRIKFRRTMNEKMPMPTQKPLTA